jgi:hypothetical protein
MTGKYANYLIVAVDNSLHITSPTDDKVRRGLVCSLKRVSLRYIV